MASQTNSSTQRPGDPGHDFFTLEWMRENLFLPWPWPHVEDVAGALAAIDGTMKKWAGCGWEEPGALLMSRSQPLAHPALYLSSHSANTY